MASPRPTISDVAAAAVVSKVTVSRVLSGQTKHIRPETQARVRAAAAALGYTPSIAAASLRTHRSYTVALVIPDITNPIWPAVARGVQAVARDAGYSVVLSDADWNERAEQDALAMAQRARMDGVLINPTHTTNDALCAAGIPAVILSSRADFPDFDSVGVDTEGGAALAVAHLAALGHRRIALIAPLAFDSGRARQAGFARGLAACGLPDDPALHVDAPYTQTGGRVGLDALLALHAPPTAVFAANDEIAIGALHRAQERGVPVPGRLSIVGLDDTPAAAVTTPPLTTLHRPQRAYGEIAMQYLLARITGDAPSTRRRRRFPCELVVRGSAAPPDGRNDAPM